MNKESSGINNIKVWLFPSLFSVLGLFLYDSITEMKTDIKQLLAQSNSDKVRIDMLIKEVDALQAVKLVIPPAQPSPDEEHDSQHGKFVMVYDNKKLKYNFKRC